MLKVISLLGLSVCVCAATIGNTSAIGHRHRGRADQTQAYPAGLSTVFETDLESAFGRNKDPDYSHKDDDASCKVFAKAKCDELKGELSVFGVGCVGFATVLSDSAATARSCATAFRRTRTMPGSLHRMP